MARVNCLSWAPDSTHLASGSLDTAIIIWDVQNPTKHITYKSTPFSAWGFIVFLMHFVFVLHLFLFAEAHPQSQITRLSWINGDRLVSTGQDSNVKIWNVTF